MSKKLVYDWPLRIFHWLFVGLFLTAFLIAKTIDDDSPLYAYHMLAGLSLFFLVLLRIAWGVIGTKHARFTHFVLHPNELINYLKGMVIHSTKMWAGHNPASSWAGIVMILMAIGLGSTGILMSTGSKEEFEDLHELFGNIFVSTALLHLAGIIFHSIRHKDLIGLSMLHGKKINVQEADQIHSPKTEVGILLILLMFTFGFYLFKNYNPETQKLNLMGKILTLGEDED